ncbi:hypothetical protein LSUE1_G001961 [Lachnellula suecica]|uniref:Uncharacterized protein n=1 Tax=Lachnellula suecica TaxID=602035 RepID=A0A8T9CJE2_9HELO|nr:hypothetical protein LSUE1_G001961 [Lachnellula suecica]
MVAKLPYTLHSRYRSIAIAWTVIIIPPIFLNLGLFYGLWYGTHMDRIAVLTIPTAVLGIFTVIAIVERVWKLIQPSPQFRPLHSPRYGLDIFQWGYFAALLLISALISSTLARGDNDQDDHELQTRLVSMPAPFLMFFLATLTLLSLLLNALAIKIPFRFGSLDAGNTIRPAIYYIVEDVVAVDGNGGLEYREAWTARYDGSPVFRRMIWTLSVAWMVAFYVLAGVFTTLVFVLPKAAVYAVGWAGPFPLAGMMALWTIYYVKSMLREEEMDELEGRMEMVPGWVGMRGLLC